MNEDPQDPTAGDQIEHQAASWLIRTERGLTAAEQDEFLLWLTADSRHGAALAQHKRNWKRLDLLGEWKPEHSPRPNRDLLAPPPNRLLTFPPVGRTWRVALSLAAALVLGFFVSQQMPPAAAPMAPDAPIALIEERTLEDGSIIAINRGAIVNVRYTPQERQVQLVVGEAHFTVAKNSARPFIVTAGNVAVRAVGTAFNVRLGASEVDVLVTEGTVQVNRPTEGTARESPAPLVVLEAGERTTVPMANSEPAAPIATVAPEQVRQLLAWQPTTLEFTAAPLFNIVNEFNLRNAPVRILIADTVLAGTEVSASLRSDNVEGFLRLLEAGFGVNAERNGSTVILRRAR